VNGRFPADNLFAGLILIIMISAPGFAQAPGSSPSHAAPAGMTLTGIVECGEGYTSHELYDMKITLVEVIRGEAAWKRIREAGASNKPAESGSEYILARVRFEYKARAIPGLCEHPLSPEQFTAYNANGEDYRPAAVLPPKPEMRKGLKSGDTFEGWVVFMVSQQDKTPLMSYSVGDGGAVQHGGDQWFALR
jgi:hypothetical protein